MKVDASSRMYSEIQFDRRPLPPRFSLSNKPEKKPQPAADCLPSLHAVQTPYPPRPELIPIDDPVIKPPRTAEARQLNEVA